MINDDTKINPKWYFYVLTASIILEYLRPQESYLSVLSPLHIPAFCQLLMAFIFISNSKNYIRQEKGYRLMIAFWLIATVSVIYALNTRQTYDNSMLLLFMGIAFIFPFTVIVNDVNELLRFWKLWFFVHVVLAIIVLQQGGTGPGGILRDENDVALALVISFPFIFYYFYYPGQGAAKKISIIFCGAVVLAAIGFTQSRGGMLGLLAVIFVMLLMSNKPVRNGIALLVIGLIFGGAIIGSLPEEYVLDMINMANPEDSTRDERLYSWGIAWAMFIENPIFGVGSGNFPWVNHLYYQSSPLYEPGRKFMGGRAAHSVYFTVLPELGLIGTVIYLSLMKIIYNRIRRAKKCLKKAKESDELIKIQLFFNALLASLLGFMTGGIFLSVLFYPFFWYLACFSIVAYRVSNNKFYDESGHLIDFDKKNSAVESINYTGKRRSL